jgi:hypothetical protein
MAHTAANVPPTGHRLGWGRGTLAGQVSEIVTDITTLESPLGAMYLLHKAPCAEARRVETAAGQVEESVTLQAFRQALAARANF